MSKYEKNIRLLHCRISNLSSVFAFSRPRSGLGPYCPHMHIFLNRAAAVDRDIVQGGIQKFHMVQGMAVFSRKSGCLWKGSRQNQCFCCSLIRSCIRAFDWYRYQRPWMTLKGHYMLAISKYIHLSEQS